MYNNSYKHNGNTLLAYHILDLDALKGVDYFVDVIAEDMVASGPGNRKMVWTLEGWKMAVVGDYILHLFATPEKPVEICTDEKKSYTDTGFLVINDSIFEKHFDLISKDL